MAMFLLGFAAGFVFAGALLIWALSDFGDRGR